MKEWIENLYKDKFSLLIYIFLIWCVVSLTYSLINHYVFLPTEERIFKEETTKKMISNYYK